VFEIAERSSVFRGILRASKEKKDGKLVIRMEDDVRFEVIEVFLTFLYSGKLEDGERSSIVPSGRPAWIDLLPELVQMAHEVMNRNSRCDITNET